MSQPHAATTPGWLRATRRAVLFAIVLCVLFGVQTVRIITDWQWFAELGQRAVFSTGLAAKLILFFGIGIAVFILVSANLWLAHTLNASRPRPHLLDAEREQFAEVARKVARWATWAGSLILAFLMGGNASSRWSEYLLFTHPTRFGVADPVFGYDIGYFVFRVPFMQFLQGLAFTAVGITILAVALVYYGDRAMDIMANAPVTMASYVRRHLLWLGAVLATVWAWGLWLGRLDVLYTDNGAFFGAGFTDITARLPATIVQAGLMLLLAVACAINAHRGKLLLGPGIALGGWVAASVIGLAVWPGLVQRFRVVPNQFRTEERYIRRDMEFTRRAYNLQDVAAREIDGVEPLTAATLAQNEATVGNIRLWDWPQLGAVFEAKQALRPYYSFRLPEGSASSTGSVSIDIDRYRFGNDIRQVMLAPRELQRAGLPRQAQTWVNERLQYTHGYGAVMSPVHRVDSDGLPEYFLEQIPVKSRQPGLKLDQPGIYYGELANDYVFVDSKQNEFDYPAGVQNQEVRYRGTGGVPLGNEANRLAWSIRLGDANMLLSGDLSARTRILFRRNIRERVQTLAPFLNWDNDPYIVVHKGRLVWIMDGYTTTDRYPYSRPVSVGSGVSGVEQQFSYIRNSIKATVDAYDGTVRFYVSDRTDPIIGAWRRIYPGLFTDISAMPADLREHLRYPEDLFRVQRDIYTVYHITDPKVYYSKEDQWAVPTDPTRNDDGIASQSRMAPYYVIMRPPDIKSDEFLLITPFIPLSTQNMSAWMCARCDPANYGQLLVYRFPKGSNVNGPQQIMAQVNSQQEISRVVSLLDQRGSKVTWGNLLVIPVEKALMYALPLYVQASGQSASAIPEISQVVLASGDKIVMRPTLDEAVQALVPGVGSTKEPGVGRAAPGATGVVQPTAPISAGPIEKALEALATARGRQRDYGAALDDLEKALRRIQQSQTKP